VLFDVAAAVLVLGAAWAGARRGAAFTAAAVLSPAAGVAYASPTASGLGLDGPWGPAAAYLLLSFLIFAAAAAVRRVLGLAGLRAWDRHLGLLSGAAIGTALAVALFAGLLAVRPDLADGLRASRAGRAIEAARDVLPRPARDVLARWGPAS
jgi:hypothetical protein